MTEEELEAEARLTAIEGKLDELMERVEWLEDQVQDLFASAVAKQIIEDHAESLKTLAEE